MPKKIETFKARQTLPSHLPTSSANRKADRRFYGRKAWVSLQQAKRKADPLCEECRKAGDLVPARHVHHIQEVKARPDLAFEWSNLVSLCHSCHSKAHSHQLKANAKAARERGV